MKCEYQHKPVKNLAIEDRPREKLIEKGVKTMTNSELLAILIGSGSHETNAIELSRDILNNYNNDLGLLMKADIYDLMKFKGIGHVKAVKIVAAVELVQRSIKSVESTKKEPVKISKDVYSIFRPMIGFSKYEEFWVLYLNRSLYIISKNQISQGSLHATTIDIKKIVKTGLDLMASSMILVHNHPSGNPKPSKEDISITKKVIQAGKVFDIQVTDHVVICDNTYYSFADNDLLE